MAVLKSVLLLEDKFTVKMNQAIKATNNFIKANDKLNDALNNTKKHSENLVNPLSSVITKIGLLTTASLGAKKALSTMFSGVQLNNTQNSQLLAMQASYGDHLGTNVYKYVSEYAKSSALGREDLAYAVSQSAPFIKDSEQLERYLNLLDRLYAKSPEQGAEGASFALKELMSGDVMSARSRYGLNFSGEKLRSLDGNEKLDYIEEVFNKYGLTAKLVEKQTETLGVKWNIFTSNLKTKFGEASGVIADKLETIVDKFNVMLDSGKLDVFINAFIKGFNFIIDGVVNVINFFNQLFTVIKNNAFIQGLLFTGIVIGAVMGTGALLKMASVFSLLIVRATVLMVRLMMAHLPLTLLIGGFILLASIFNDGTNNFIQGAINVIMAWVRVFNALWILLQMLWNFLVEIAENVVNLFLKMKNGLVDVLSGLATACLNALEPLTKMMDKIFGSNLTNSLNTFKTKTKSAIDSLKTDEVNFNSVKAVYKDFSTPLENKLKDMFHLNKKAEQSLAIDNEKLDLSGFNDLNKEFSNLNEDGVEIKNNKPLDVKLSNEDLKYLKDISAEKVRREIKSSSVNPVVNFTINGNVEENSFYKIQKTVEKILTEELSIITNV